MSVKYRKETTQNLFPIHLPMENPKQRNRIRRIAQESRLVQIEPDSDNRVG